ncbi:hypothetical protein AMATHDRAFT_69736 [Amanita thiersii Skay4041]|uniref:Uncharacterized protein n=1 Tax=Amanita thiersii Skay4041 TaxID=703135 RepID=A0A2A9N961_9AGAR|nr:hypothetical protein AMATHDRAFT_69736 [Amanita thiersii Skay4041]
MGLTHSSGLSSRITITVDGPSSLQTEALNVHLVSFPRWSNAQFQFHPFLLSAISPKTGVVRPPYLMGFHPFKVHPLRYAQPYVFPLSLRVHSKLVLVRAHTRMFLILF